MNYVEKEISVKKALVMFTLAAFLVVAAGIAFGELFIWNKYDQASPVDKDIRRMEAALQGDRNDDGTLVELGWLYYRKGDYQTAQRMLNRAVEINKQNPAAHFNLGLVYRETGLPGKAEAEFIRTLELDPESRFAYFALGKLYYDQKKWTDAIEKLRLAVEKDPVSADNYFWLAKAYEAKGYKEEALAAYSKVMEMLPDHSEAKEAYYRLK